MILFFESLKETKDTYLYLLITLILIGDTLDFTFGWLNARFNKDVVFQSNIALHGIVKKIMYFITLVFFIPIAFSVLETEIAYVSITTLYIGYLASTVNSICSHLGLSKDGKKGSLFIDFMKNIFGKDEKQ